MNNENDASCLVLFLAPVKEFLEDDKVSEILINGPKQIYIEREGKLQETEAVFANEAQLRAAASNIAKSVDRQLDEMHPDLDARLPDGSRVHATIPPISRCGTIISIRKFKKEMLTMEKLESFGSIPHDGMLLLNVGPGPDGTIPSGSVTRLAAMGEWMAANGETIYGTRATMLKPQPWGVLTHKEGKIFLHVMEMPQGGTITLPFPLKVKKGNVKAFADGTSLPFKKTKTDFTVQLTADADCSIDYIIEINL